MISILEIFKDEKGRWSSKRIVGVFGMVVVHLCYAYRVIFFGDTTDTLILVTADTALLGVETITKAISHDESTTDENATTGSHAKHRAEYQG